MGWERWLWLQGQSALHALPQRHALSRRSTAVLCGPAAVPALPHITCAEASSLPGPLACAARGSARQEGRHHQEGGRHWHHQEERAGLRVRLPRLSAPALYLSPPPV